MATATRCAPGNLRAHKSVSRMALLLAVMAGVAAVGFARPAHAAFDDGQGACTGDWGSSDSSGSSSGGDNHFSVGAGGCPSGNDGGGDISLTGDTSNGDCGGITLSAGDIGDCGDATGGWGCGDDHGYQSSTINGGEIVGDTVRFPEPGSFALFGVAAGGLLMRRNEKKLA